MSWVEGGRVDGLRGQGREDGEKATDKAVLGGEAEVLLLSIATRC